MKNQVMKKATINFIINALMFLCMSAVVGIGFLIKYTLINGQERWIVYKDNVELYFWGLDRHEWGAIHLIIGYVFLGLLVLHIVLHWKIIVCVYDKIFQKKQVRKLISIVFITVCLLLIVVPFLIKPSIGKTEKGAGKQTTDYNKPIKTEDNITQENKNLDITKHTKTHKRPYQRIEIKGFMSLDEISKKYQVPTKVIKTKLNVPISISDNQKLSWIRKKYNIEMHDVEAIIKEYQEEK